MLRTAILIGHARWRLDRFRVSGAPLNGTRRRSLWVAVAILALSNTPQQSWASDYPVTTTNSSGPGSFLAALISANGDPGSTITFQNGLGTINVGMLPDLTGSITINGGVGNTLSGQGTGRILFINSPSQTIQINNLTLANGLAQGGNGSTGGGGGGGGAGLGGAVFVNAGNVIFSSVVFNNNAAKGGNGANASMGGGGGGGGLSFAGGTGSENADANLLGAGGGGGAKTSAGVSASGSSAGQGGGLRGGVSGSTTADGSGGNASGPDGGGGGGFYDPFDHNEGFNGGIGGTAADFGGGGGGGSSVHDDAGRGGTGGFGGGGGGGGNAINNGIAGPGGAGGFGGGGGGSGGETSNIGTILGGSGGFDGGGGGSSNQGAGGGGAALGGSVFVRSGATVSFTDVSMEVGSLTAGSGGLSPLGQGHNGGSGSAAGGALFLMGGNTTFTVSSAGMIKTISGSIAESSASGITKTGLGTLILSGANSYTGGTTVSGGTLRISNLALPGSTAAISSGAVLQYNDSGILTQPAFTFTGSGTLLKTGGGLLVFGGQGNVNVGLAAGGLIDVQGGELVGSSSYQGIWTSNQASLNIASIAKFDAVEGGPSGFLQIDALSGAGSFTGGYFGAFGAVTTATLGVAGGSGDFSGSLGDDSGAHLAIVKNGAGTQTLSGVNTYTGGTTINGGKLVVNGSITGAVNVNNNATLGGSGNVAGLVTVASGGALSPGSSPGVLTVGSLALQSGAQTDIELGGNTRGSLYDAVVSNGAATLNGTLQVAPINGFSPSSGQSFDILDWGSLIGTFSALQLPTLVGGLAWNTSQLYTAGVLSVGFPGDFNANGIVDAADYVVWRKGLGTTYVQAEYTVWRTHFGQPPGSGAGAITTTAVPEPTTLILFIIGAIAMCFHGRAAVS